MRQVFFYEADSDQTKQLNIYVLAWLGWKENRKKQEMKAKKVRDPIDMSYSTVFKKYKFTDTKLINIAVLKLKVITWD